MFNTKCNVSFPSFFYLFVDILWGKWMCHCWLFCEFIMEHSINMQTVLFNIVHCKSVLE